MMAGMTVSPELLTVPEAATGVACEYPDCREIATTVIVIERGRGSIRRLLCDTHSAQAQMIAKQHDGIAYRLYPT